MEAWPAYLFAICFISLILFSVWSDWRESERLKNAVVVNPAQKYPNNHHVIGVGYYHATCRMWHRHPWNEFREGIGYFWDGKWDAEPDMRQVPFSEPDKAEIDRVNQLWREANPESMRRFWADVERGGFGYAVSRTRGS